MFGLTFSESIYMTGNNTIKMLVIDDESDVIDLFSTYFDEEEISIVGATGAQDALEKLQETHIDVVITDIIMPGQKDGLDVVVDIRESYPDISIVAMTGFYDSKDKTGFLQAAEALGADAIFYKPLSLKELYDKVIELTDSKKAS